MLCCFVLFPDEGILQTETCSNIQCDIAKQNT